MTANSIPVGNTPLDLLSDDPRDGRVWVKREDCNPFGTHKDRRSALIRKEYLEQPPELRPDVLAMISAGNAARSLRRITKDLPVSVRSLLSFPSDSYSIRRALKKLGVDIGKDPVLDRLSSCEIIRLLRHDAGERIWNVTNGYEFAYAQIVREIFEVTEPDTIVCPIGSGELLVGLHRGLTELGLAGTALVGVTVERTARSKAKKLEAIVRPYHEQIQEIFGESFRSRQITMNAKEVLSAIQKIPKGITAEPSAAVVFGVPERLNFVDRRNIVLINTGKGIV